MKKRKSQRSRKSKGVQIATPVINWRYLALFVLVGLSLCIVIMRLHTYNEPFERDITSHAVIAHELLSGRQLYSDLWDSKPPAIFVTYAAADVLVGYGPGAVYFIGVAAAIITMLGIYLAASTYGGIAAGLWAAAFWTFICSDMWLWANQPNIEVGMNACLVWAFALMVRANVRKLEVWRWLGVGGLFALATLYKPVAIVFAAFLTVFHLVMHLRDREARKLAFLQVCMVAAVGAAVWGAVFAYFAATGRFAVFYETIIKYSKYYAASRGGNFIKNIQKGFTFKRLFPITKVRPIMKNALVMLIFTAVGIMFGLWKSSRRRWLLLAGFVLAAPFAVALPGRFYLHYYQLWLGPLAIGAGCALATVGPQGKPITKLLRVTAGAIGLVILLISILPQYKLSADEWSARKISDQFVTSKKVVTKVDELLENGETLYVWGQNPEFYFWSKRRPPTGLIWSTDLMDNPLAEKHTARALEDLKRELPEIFVVNIAQFKRPPDHPVIAWVSKQYIRLPSYDPKRYTWLGRPFFLILIHKDGRLAARFKDSGRIL